MGLGLVAAKHCTESNDPFVAGLDDVTIANLNGVPSTLRVSGANLKDILEAYVSVLPLVHGTLRVFPTIS